jgi:hypothetical protein
MEVYELNGEIYDNVEVFIEALAHEYKAGDSELVLSKLDDYGLELSDIGVRPSGV